MMSNSDEIAKAAPTTTSSSATANKKQEQKSSVTAVNDDNDNNNHDIGRNVKDTDCRGGGGVGGDVKSGTSCNDHGCDNNNDDNKRTETAVDTAAATTMTTTTTTTTETTTTPPTNTADVAATGDGSTAAVGVAAVDAAPPTTTRNRSVNDYRTDDELRRALLVDGGHGRGRGDNTDVARKRPLGDNNEDSHIEQDSSARKQQEPSTSKDKQQQSQVQVQQDWRLDNYDPETTTVQTMKDELRRLQVLKQYLILDSDREDSFERLTSMAARIFHVPIALVSLVDLGRQWFMSNHGLPHDVRETPRRHAFCSHTIQRRNKRTTTTTKNNSNNNPSDDNNNNSSANNNNKRTTTASSTNVQNYDLMLIVTDATKDFRFRDNPLVTGPPNIRFYAGAPLVSPEGYNMGTFCIIDNKTRPDGLTDDEKATMMDFADMAVKIMVDRRHQLLASNNHSNPGELIACAAHDLMTPLTGVQLSLSLLTEDDDVRKRLGEHQFDLLSTAASCSDLMIRICQTAIDAVRREAISTTTTTNDSTFMISSAAASAGQSGGHVMGRDSSSSTFDKIGGGGSGSSNVGGVIDHHHHDIHSNNNNNNMYLDENDELQYELPTTNTEELVRSLQMILDPIPKLTPLIITLDTAVPRYIICDDLKLFRSSLNLISSAAERTELGFIHLRIFVKKLQQQQSSSSTSPPSACSPSTTYSSSLLSNSIPNSSSSTSRRCLIFQCEDSGTDFPVEEYPYLFESIPSEVDGSLRLGLSSVASLIKSLGGEYGFRPRCNNNNNTSSTSSSSNTNKEQQQSKDGKPTSAGDGHDIGESQSSKRRTGSIFWFSIPLVEPGSINNNVPAAAAAAGPAAAAAAKADGTSSAAAAVAGTTTAAAATTATAATSPLVASASSNSSLSTSSLHIRTTASSAALTGAGVGSTVGGITGDNANSNNNDKRPTAYLNLKRRTASFPSLKLPILGMRTSGSGNFRRSGSGNSMIRSGSGGSVSSTGKRRLPFVVNGLATHANAVNDCLNDVFSSPTTIQQQQQNPQQQQQQPGTGVSAAPYVQPPTLKDPPPPASSKTQQQQPAVVVANHSDTGKKLPPGSAIASSSSATTVAAVVADTTTAPLFAASAVATATATSKPTPPSSQQRPTSSSSSTPTPQPQERRKAVAVTTTPSTPSTSTGTGTAAAAATTSATRRRKRRALLIEDTALVRKSLERALKKLGFDVSQAVNGLEGLVAMKNTLFDIVLCDFLMPVMDGLDCVKQYRAWEAENRSWFQQLIVGISAHANVNDRGQGIEAGMNSFKPKPISIKTLTELQGSEEISARTKKIDEVEDQTPESSPMDDSPVSNVALTGGEGSTSQVQISSSHDAVAAGAGNTANTTSATSDRLKRSGSDASTGGGNSERRSSKRQRIEASDAKDNPVCLMASGTTTTTTTEKVNNDVQSLLVAHGWTVVVVSDGGDAIRHLQVRNWDAVLIDDDLPGSSSGFQCVQTFREWEEQNRVNGQRNVFVVVDGDIPSPFEKSSVVQSPIGFDGVLRRPVAWADMQYLILKNSREALDIVVRKK